MREIKTNLDFGPAAATITLPAHELISHSQHYCVQITQSAKVRNRMTNSEQTPEEVELKQKEESLRQKQDILTERELTLSTLQADLRSFEVEYYLKLGEKYVHIDRLQATLDRLIASRIPQDIFAGTRASESEARARKSANDAESFKERSEKASGTFKPTAELKALYRELAKLLHPDLTLDPNEKVRRNSLMQQVNNAYQTCDLMKLKELWEAEKNNPDNIKGDDIGSSLVRAIRRIAQIEKRIQDLDAELAAIRKTDLFVLFDTVKRAEKNGVSLLDDMSAKLESRVVFLQNQIAQMNQ
jgi:hypothetical protein